MKGHFITFEGIDGCGKSTQLRLTGAWLKNQGQEVVTTFEPGDHSMGSEIRQLLLSSEYQPVAEAEFFLFLADRAQHIHEVIEPALARGAWVLCDRFSDSTISYQLAGRKLDSVKLKPMLEFAELGFRPTLTLWLDLAVETALTRIRSRAQTGEGTTRIDEERLSFHNRVRDGFEALHCQQPERICVIQADENVERVQHNIRSEFSNRFNL
ncbi:MAG: dTMP kinase [Mariprofundaceae bacterium]